MYKKLIIGISLLALLSGCGLPNDSYCMVLSINYLNKKSNVVEVMCKGTREYLGGTIYHKMDFITSSPSDFKVGDRVYWAKGTIND